MSGRLTKYSDEAYSAVIKDIAAGTPLANALGGKDRPGRTAFYQRLKEDASLAREYDAAMQQRAQVRVDELLDVNQRLLEGRIDPASAKVISQNLQWLAAKESPKQYGEVTRTELTGRDGRDLLPTSPPLSDFEVARGISFLLHKGAKAAPAAIEAGELKVIGDAD